MSTSPRQDAYRAVLAHLHTHPAVTAGYDLNNQRAVRENARVWTAVTVALDAAGVPALPGGVDANGEPLPCPDVTGCR